MSRSAEGAEDKTFWCSVGDLIRCHCRSSAEENGQVWPGAIADGWESGSDDNG